MHGITARLEAEPFQNVRIYASNLSYRTRETPIEFRGSKRRFLDFVELPEKRAIPLRSE